MKRFINLHDDTVRIDLRRFFSWLLQNINWNFPAHNLFSCSSFWKGGKGMKITVMNPFKSSNARQVFNYKKKMGLLDPELDPRTFVEVIVIVRARENYFGFHSEAWINDELKFLSTLTFLVPRKGLKMRNKKDDQPLSAPWITLNPLCLFVLSDKKFLQKKCNWILTSVVWNLKALENLRGNQMESSFLNHFGINWGFFGAFTFTELIDCPQGIPLCV